MNVVLVVRRWPRDREVPRGLISPGPSEFLERKLIPYVSYLGDKRECESMSRDCVTRPALTANLHFDICW